MEEEKKAQGGRRDTPGHGGDEVSAIRRVKAIRWGRKMEGREEGRERDTRKGKKEGRCANR